MIDTETAPEFGPDLNFPVLEFTAWDRCDGCGSQAYTIARHMDHVTELLFCFHHRNELVNKLEEEGWVLTDDEEGIARDLFPKQFADIGA